MNLDPSELRDLQISIADQIYIQVANWRLYLGDAGLAEALSVECIGRSARGPSVAVKEALEAIKVPLAGGMTSLPLSELIPSEQVRDLQEILEPYCR